MMKFFLKGVGILFFGVGLLLVNPVAVSALSVSGTVSPTKVSPGGTVKLTWDVSGAKSCTISYLNSPSNNLPLSNGAASGQKSFSGVTEKETYCIDCVDDAGASDRDCAGFSIASKINSFTASPATVAAGESTTLSWDSKDADRCDIGVGATNISGKQPASGSYVVYPAVTTTYKLSCLNEALGYSSDNASTVVTVSGVSGTAPVANISANGTAGHQSMLVNAH